MARIHIEPAKAKRSVLDEQSLEKKLSNLSQEVSSIRSNMRYKISGREQISDRLRQVAQQISKEATSTRALSNGLQQVITKYEQTENAARDRAKADKTSVQKPDIAKVLREASEIIRKWAGFPTVTMPTWPQPGIIDWMRDFPWAIPIVGPILPISIGAVTTATSLIKYLTQDDKAFDPTIAKYESRDGRSSEEVEFVSDTKVNLTKSEKDKGGWAKDLDDWKDKHSKDKSFVQSYYNSKTGKIEKVDPNDKEASKEFAEHNKGSLPVDFRLAGVGTSGKVKWIGGEGEKTGDYGGVSGEWGVGQAEGHSDAYVGLLGVGASVGGSVCAITASGKAYLGNEDAQVYAKGDVTVGRVGGELGASVGLVDKDGNFNPSAYAGASVEAIAAEASASVGAKIAGTDVAVKGSVNFGVGAHANVGIHDGKISFDVGASLGVGVSVKLDIDVSGTVKAVGKAVGKVTSFIKNLF